MKCMKERKQTVIPIFCDVEPTEVRKQKGTYKEAFDKHELRNKAKVESWWKALVSNPCGWLLAPLQEYGKYREAAAKQELENKEKIESWRKALVEASNISGWETNQIANGHEAQGIKQIVAEISQRLKPLTSGENEKLVGTHQINLLNNDEAVKLFCKHAHGDYTPIKDFEQLTKQVVSYAGGLPLALTVLGAFLCDKDISQWRSALARLKEIPDQDIIGKLKISFDGLKQVEKDLFLDIACLFRWKKKDSALKLFEACGYHPVIGVEVLRQKALIVITKNGEFDMHDLVQEMGHYIVREEDPKNPEKRSRVWKREDVSRVLDMAATTKLDNIEAIDLEYVRYEESQRFLQVAGNMNKLRWIDLLYYGQKQRDEIIVPLPENFPPPQLCYLYAKNCIRQKQLWKGKKHLPNLRHMELDDMPNLIKIPDLSGLPNLETFKLLKCPCLEEIHPSIGRLEMLVFLYIQFCPRLRMFPSITRIKKLETLSFDGCEELERMSDIQQEMANVPHNMNRRRLQFSHSTLRKLDLRWCSLGDEEIGSDVWDLPNLEELDLRCNTLITRLDFSILRLPRLKWLNVSYCISLVELSELPSSIAVVHADHCWSLESFGDISNCKWLWKVSIKGKNKLGQLGVDTLIHSMLQGNAIEDHFIDVVLVNQLPNRFVGRLFSGNIFRLHLPDDWYNDFSGFLICVVTSMRKPHIKIKIGQEDLSHESDEAVEPTYDRKWTKTFVGYVSFSSLRRHTKLLTSSYNIISVTIKHVDSFYGGIELIPGKSKSDVDKQIQDEYYAKTFTIQQSDSDSSIKIKWRP